MQDNSFLMKSTNPLGAGVKEKQNVILWPDEKTEVSPVFI